jgi:integrase/recombinase XerD
MVVKGDTRRPRQGAATESSEVGAFVRSLADRGASINTVEAYRSDLEQLVEFLKSRRQGTALSGLDRAGIEKFVDYLKSSGYRDSSVARKLAALRGFFVFLAEEGAVQINPAKGLSYPIVRHPIEAKVRTRALTPDEAGALLDQVGRRSTAGAKRDRAMLELLYATGMRVTELVSLNVDDLKFDSPTPYVLCPSRAGRKRPIPIGDQAVAAVSDYLALERPKIVISENEQSLFVSQRGKRLSRQGFWLILKGYARAANLADVSPQTFRASFVSRALGSGTTAGKVQTLLGHSPAPNARTSNRRVAGA